LYQHVADSDGAIAVDGAEALLMFHPSGSAFILATLPRTMLAREGQFRVDGEALAIRFQDGDFAREGFVALDLSRATMVLPWKLYSNGEGRSTWRLQADGLAVRSYAVYNAFTAARGASEERAIAFAAAYARAFVARPPGSEPPGQTEVEAKPENSSCRAIEPFRLSSVAESSSGLSFDFEAGPRESVLLSCSSNRPWAPASSFSQFARRGWLPRLWDRLQLGANSRAGDLRQPNPPRHAP
jgi:hypothetical protein